MVISQPPGNNFQVLLSCFTNAASIALNASRDTFYVLYMQLQHQGNSEMVLLSIFYTNQIHGGIISRLFLFILSLHALALHLAVKILLQIFLYEDLSTLALHTSVGCISLQNASRTALCYATNTIK